LSFFNIYFGLALGVLLRQKISLIRNCLPIEMMMFGKLSVAIMGGAYAVLTNAAIIEMFSDQNCQNSVGSRNVWDNTCATGVPGFQSYIITTAGGSGQDITTWSGDACAGVYTTCNNAGSIEVCYPAFDSSGGSNAISSAVACGFA
jgi:hypothetical protein